MDEAFIFGQKHRYSYNHYILPNKANKSIHEAYKTQLTSEDKNTNIQNLRDPKSEKLIEQFKK